MVFFQPIVEHLIHVQSFELSLPRNIFSLSVVEYAFFGGMGI